MVHSDPPTHAFTTVRVAFLWLWPGRDGAYLRQASRAAGHSVTAWDQLVTALCHLPSRQLTMRLRNSLLPQRRITMFRNKRWLLGAAPMIFVCILSACSPRVVITTPYDLALGAATSLAVHTSGGDITVKPGPAGTLHVEAERVALTESQARALNVSVKLDGDVARVDWTGTTDYQHLSFTVTAPAALPVDLNSGGGDVSTSDLTGAIAARTGGGNINIDNAKAPIDADTGGGNISVTHYSGAVKLVSGGGHIRLDGTLSGQSSLQTFGGSINTTLPAQSRLMVSAKTKSGRASNDFGLPITTTDEIQQSFAGDIGDGHDGSLQINTSAGDVVLQRE
jgi:hypothetical protein